MITLWIQCNLKLQLRLFYYYFIYDYDYGDDYSMNVIDFNRSQLHDYYLKSGLNVKSSKVSVRGIKYFLIIFPRRFWFRLQRKCPVGLCLMKNVFCWQEMHFLSLGKQKNQIHLIILSLFVYNQPTWWFVFVYVTFRSVGTLLTWGSKKIAWIILQLKILHPFVFK